MSPYESRYMGRCASTYTHDIFPSGLEEEVLTVVYCVRQFHPRSDFRQGVDQFPRVSDGGLARKTTFAKT